MDVDSDAPQRFADCARRWRRATEYASLTEMEAHPARAEIKSLGPEAVALILAELEARPDVRWLGLLTELTGVDPAAGAQSVAQAATAWRRWDQARA
jgi:hypothetical protein